MEAFPSRDLEVSPGGIMWVRNRLGEALEQSREANSSWNLSR
jgi:hypothetical protein